VIKISVSQPEWWEFQVKIPFFQQVWQWFKVIKDS
jgi:hypothetical protein